jgi:hypothetical protein
LSRKERQVVSRLSRPRWSLALLLSLALHGLVVVGLARLPGREVAPRVAGCAVGGGCDAQLDGDADTYAYLVSPATPVPAHLPSPPPSISLIAKAQPRPPIPPPALAGLSSGIKGETHGFANTGPSPEHSPGVGGTIFFKIPVRAEKVVYVIDRSASMGLRGALDTARRELRASLHRLPPTAQFQVIVYSSRAEPLLPSQPGWLAATAENKELVAIALGVLPAEGSTRHDQALPRALALQPDVIFFLTDADDLTDRDVRTVTEHNRGRSVIHVVELSTANRQRPGMPLQALARANGGMYHAVDLGGGQ